MMIKLNNWKEVKLWQYNGSQDIWQRQGEK